MDKEVLGRKHGRLKWIANVDKDDQSVRRRGHFVGPPRAEDEYSVEELEEKGVVGIYVRIKKDKKR